jgi:hypothetical protein
MGRGLAWLIEIADLVEGEVLLLVGAVILGDIEQDSRNILPEILMIVGHRILETIARPGD